MDVSKYKPGRRLDAMVAMCLGWKWWQVPPDESGPAYRWLSHERQGSQEPGQKHTRPCTAFVGGLKNEGRIWCMDVPHWSTNPGIAFEAALEAGVFERGLYLNDDFGHWGHNFFVLDRNRDVVARTHSQMDRKEEARAVAHCLCLGILAIQPEDKLAEFESWLEDIE